MPETDFADMAAALEAVRDNPAPILVVTHEWPDGDAVGSACGLCTLLRDNGFRAEFFLAAQMPDCYRPLLPNSAKCSPTGTILRCSLGYPR